MTAGIARLVLALLATIALLAAWTLLVLVGMGVSLYAARLFPLTGQWLKRFRMRRNSPPRL